MRKLLIVFAVFLMGGLAVAAQDQPKVEGFLGYSYFRFSPPSSSGISSFGLNGASGSISYNPIPALGSWPTLVATIPGASKGYLFL